MICLRQFAWLVSQRNHSQDRYLQAKKRNVEENYEENNNIPINSCIIWMQYEP